MKWRHSPSRHRLHCNHHQDRVSIKEQAALRRAILVWATIGLISVPGPRSANHLTAQQADAAISAIPNRKNRNKNKITQRPEVVPLCSGFLSFQAGNTQETRKFEWHSTAMPCTHHVTERAKSRPDKRAWADEAME